MHGLAPGVAVAVRRCSQQPYELIWRGPMDVTKPYEFIRFGDIHGPKTYKFMGFRWASISQHRSLRKPATHQTFAPLQTVGAYFEGLNATTRKKHQHFANASSSTRATCSIYWTVPLVLAQRLLESSKHYYTSHM